MLDSSRDLVSIVVPVFNSTDTLEECLESVCMQSYANIEAIVVDDGSTDASFVIASSFVDSDSRFTLVRQENSGVGIARNNALTRCRGEWVFFLDADDFLPPTAIEDLVAATDPNTDMVVGSIQKFRSILNWHRNVGLIERGNHIYFTDGRDEPLSELDDVLSLVAPKLLRRSVIVDGPIVFGSVPYSEDHRFGLAFVATGTGTVKTIDNVVYFYRSGGAASAVRCYPNMDQISLSMMAYYRDICTASPRFFMDETFCHEAPARWLDGVLMHFSTCLPRHQVREKCLTAIEEFSALGEPYRFLADAPAFYMNWKKSHRIKITAKRFLRSIRLHSVRG